MHFRRFLGLAPATLLGAIGGAALLSAVLHGQASAAPLDPVEVIIESCSRTYTSGIDTRTYAEHAFPGVSRRQLASVRAIGHVPQGTSAPPGYEFVVADSSMFVRDGALAVSCGNEVVASFDSIAFLVPRLIAHPIEGPKP
jgi:hypothetical protein